MDSNVWQNIQIENEIYTISSVVVNNEWKILLTNLVKLYIGRLSRENILEKCKRLNPLLSIEDFDVDKEVNELLKNIPKYVVNATFDEIKLQTPLHDGIFTFTVNLIKANDCKFWTEITRPLCQRVAELQKQNEFFVDEITRKDEEIEEYKACGGTLLRKHMTSTSIDNSPIPYHEQDEKTFIPIFQAIVNKRTSAVKINNIEKDKDVLIGKIEPKTTEETMKKITTEVADELPKKNQLKIRPKTSSSHGLLGLKRRKKLTDFIS